MGKAVAKGPAGPVKRLIVPIVIVLFCLAALSALFLIDTRRAAWERAGATASRMVAAIASDMSRNFETLDLSLQAVVDDLKRPDIKDIALGPGSNVTLSRTDGTVLMRWPYRAEYIGLI